MTIYMFGICVFYFTLDACWPSVGETFVVPLEAFGKHVHEPIGKLRDIPIIKSGSNREEQTNKPISKPRGKPKSQAANNE